MFCNQFLKKILKRMDEDSSSETIVLCCWSNEKLLWMINMVMDILPFFSPKFKVQFPTVQVKGLTQWYFFVNFSVVIFMVFWLIDFKFFTVVFFLLAVGLLSICSGVLIIIFRPYDLIFKWVCIISSRLLSDDAIFLMNFFYIYLEITINRRWRNFSIVGKTSRKSIS